MSRHVRLFFPENFCDFNRGGFGSPLKLRTEVFAVQGKASCPIHIITPPHFGKRLLQVRTASANPSACCFWLHSTNSSKLRGLQPFSFRKSSNWIHQAVRLHKGFSISAGIFGRPPECFIFSFAELAPGKPTSERKRESSPSHYSSGSFFQGP